jgi:hypothetical protein
VIDQPLAIDRSVDPRKKQRADHQRHHGAVEHLRIVEEQGVRPRVVPLDEQQFRLLGAGKVLRALRLNVVTANGEQIFDPIRAGFNFSVDRPGRSAAATVAGYVSTALTLFDSTPAVTSQGGTANGAWFAGDEPALDPYIPPDVMLGRYAAAKAANPSEPVWINHAPARADQ